jgi:hypothetical protein
MPLGWSREALTPSAGYRTVTQKGKVPVKTHTKAEVFWHETLLQYSVAI